MHHLTREILTTTRPLTDEARVDLWKARRRARRELFRQAFFPQSAPDLHHTPTPPSDVMITARSFFATNLHKSLGWQEPKN
jgi:hypothetical protein